MAEPNDPSKILVIVAHPDDIDFGAAGSVATWTAAGIDVVYCLVTSGDAGGDDRSESHEDRSAAREAEQIAAAHEVGVSELIFMRRPDGRLEYNLALRRDLSRVIRQVRPDRVVTQSQHVNLDRIYASHPDHLAVGAAALAAVYPDARNPFAHTELLDDEGLEPWSVPEVWIMGPQDSSVRGLESVDITDVFDKKVRALRAHVSQTAKMDNLEEMLRDWGQQSAEFAGLEAGRIAELFRRVETQ